MSCDQDGNRHWNQPRLWMLKEMIIRTLVQQVPQSAVAGHRRRESNPKRSAQDLYQAVKSADNKQQGRIFNLRLRNPEANYRQQWQERAGPFNRLGQHTNFTSSEEFAYRNTNVCNRQNDQRPVTLEESGEQPGHRQTYMHE